MTSEREAKQTLVVARARQQTHRASKVGKSVVDRCICLI